MRKSVKVGLSQTPDARITSEPTAWLSRVPLRRARGETLLRPSLPPRPETLLTVSQDALRTMLGAEPPIGENVFDQAAAAGVAEAALLSQSITRAAGAFGPMHFETRCGFKVQGAKITDAFAKNAHAERLGDFLVRIDGLKSAAANVLLTTDRGTGVVLPAIPDFLAALTFEDGELVNAAYEPADSSSRWADFQRRMGEVRALRNVIASSARFGVFRLEGEDALAMARRMQFAKSVDPTMALYAAYAYHSLNRRDRLTEMQEYLYDDLGLRFFDIALVTRELSEKRVGSIDGIFPFVPMLAQGWALLSAYQVKLPPTLQNLQRQLQSSLWTLFDSHGVSLVREAMQSDEVR